MSSPGRIGLNVGLTWAWRIPAGTSRHTESVRAFVGWVIVALLSAGLGLALYSTSLAGSDSSFQEAMFTPGPTSTVIKTKTKTKIVRKPAKTKVVYVPQAPGPTVYVAPEPVSGAGSTATTPRRTSQSDDSSHEDSDDD